MVLFALIQKAARTVRSAPFLFCSLRLSVFSGQLVEREGADDLRTVELHVNRPLLIDPGHTDPFIRAAEKNNYPELATYS